MDTLKYYVVIYMLQIFHFVRLRKTIDAIIYRVIQEKRGIFLELILFVILKTKGSIDHVDNSDRLPG